MGVERVDYYSDGEYEDALQREQEPEPEWEQEQEQEQEPNECVHMAGVTYRGCVWCELEKVKDQNKAYRTLLHDIIEVEAHREAPTPFPRRVHIVKDKAIGSAICEKYGLVYGSCASCEKDMRRHQEDERRRIARNRDDQLHKVCDAAKAFLNKVALDGMAKERTMSDVAETPLDAIDEAPPAPEGVCKEFHKELTDLINTYSIENVCDTPDFILAGMICTFIESMGPHIKRTLDWHGCDSICHPRRLDKEE